MSNTIKVTKITEYTGHLGAIYCIADNVENQWFYTSGGDGNILSWLKDGSSKDCISIGNTETKNCSILYDSDRNYLIAGDFNGCLNWIDAGKNRIIEKIPFHKGIVFDLVQTGPNCMYSVSGDGYLCKWDLDAQSPVESVRISSQGLRCLKHDDSENLLYIGSSDNSIYIVNESDLKVNKVIKNAHENSVFNLILLNYKYLISGGRDAHLKVRNTLNDSIEHDISAHWYTINKIVEIPEFNLIATASRDKTIRFWDSKSFELVKSIDAFKEGHVNSVNSLLWSPHNLTLISAGDDRKIILWKIANEI